MHSCNFSLDIFLPAEYLARYAQKNVFRPLINVGLVTLPLYCLPIKSISNNPDENIHFYVCFECYMWWY